MYTIQCGEFNDIVAWSKDGLSFCINNKVAFEKAILPVLFKPSKFESFARNLRRWGFVKISLTGKLAEEGVAYSHPDFRRGDYALCKLMSHGNDDLANTDEQQEIASILASMNTSITPSNRSQHVTGMADSSCAHSSSTDSSRRRRIVSFDNRSMVLLCDEGNEQELANATRIVSNRIVRARREHEQVPILHQQFLRVPLAEAEIRMISGQHQQVPRNQLAGGRTAEVIPYCVPFRMLYNNTSDPAALHAMLTRRLVTPTRNGLPMSYNPHLRMAQEGGCQQQGILTKPSSDTSAYSSKNNNILLPLSAVPTSDLYRSITHTLMHNHIQDKKRKMSNDIDRIMFESPHSRPF
jgi:hypothetical protein